MNLTISLGSELAVFANEITNVFTTKDYVKRLQDYYVDHVVNYYNPNLDNPFTVVHEFLTMVNDPDIKVTMCDDPTGKMSDAKVATKSILSNRRAYKHISKLMQPHCSGKGIKGDLITDLLKATTSSLNELRNACIHYNRHMGNSYDAGKVLNAVYAYGVSSGLIDYYNLEELKDGS